MKIKKSYFRPIAFALQEHRSAKCQCITLKPTQFSLPLGGHWLFLSPFSAPTARHRHDKEAIVYFITTWRIQACVGAPGSDWLALSPCDYLYFIHCGRCTGTKSSACYFHPCLSRTSHTLLALIGAQISFLRYLFQFWLYLVSHFTQALHSNTIWSVLAYSGL